MALSTHAQHQADTTEIQLSTTTDVDPASPPGDTDYSNGREACDPDRELDEAGHFQKLRLWTPEPEPYDEEKYVAWGRKHYGDDWYEQRKTMLKERNIYIMKYRDFIYQKRQEALREMEHQREKGNVPEKGKTWDELWAWARKHYGEAWYEQRQAEIRDRQEGKLSKAHKRDEIRRQIQCAIDEGLLAEGKTWHEIMTWPAGPSNVLPSVEADGDVVSSPSTSSEQSDRSGYSTYPPSDDEPRQETPRPDDPWESLEWCTVRDDMRQWMYEQNRISISDNIKTKREDEACERRAEEEEETIRKLRWTDPREYERQMGDLNSRILNSNKERVEAADRSIAKMATEPIFLFNRSITQEERNARKARLKRGRISPARPFGQQIPELGPSTATDVPVSESVSGSRVSTPRTTKDISRKTRTGKVAKNAAHNRDATLRGTRSRPAAQMRTDTLRPHRRPERFNQAPQVVEEPKTGVAEAQHQPRRRQHRAYKKKRASRRLAGQLPEFGLLPERRGEAPPLYETLLRQPSKTRMPRGSGPRSSALSKSPIIVKGAKPQGISRSRQLGRSRTERSVKSSRC